MQENATKQKSTFLGGRELFSRPPFLLLCHLQVLEGAGSTLLFLLQKPPREKGDDESVLLSPSGSRKLAAGRNRAAAVAPLVVCAPQCPLMAEYRHG